MEKILTLNEKISEMVCGLTYLSETDAKIFTFERVQSDSFTIDSLQDQLSNKKHLKIEIKDFNEFFAPLIKIQKWFGEEEKISAKRFADLKDLLQQNLKDLKVFRIGKKKIDIFVVGRDQENIWRGIQTKAVET